MGGHADNGAREGTGVHAPKSRAGSRPGAGPTLQPGDLRHDSRRAIDRRRAAETALLDEVLLPRDAAPDTVGAEAQTLLMRALRRLARQEGVGAAVAWAAEPGAEPRVLAAMPIEFAQRIEPSRDRYQAIARLDRVQRLTDSALDPDLEALGLAGAAAVVPVAGLGASAAAVLLVFAERPGRALRPRTVAIVDEEANALARSMSTTLALDRLARLDAEVQQLDRLAALGGIVSEIVHEVRNPLVSIKTFLQLLPERLDDPEFHGDYRELVSQEVQRLERLLDDLLRHARPSAKPLLGEGARVADAIETTLQLLTYRCRERGVTLETSIRDALPAVALAQDSLRQLLLNLLLNASNVTPEGGAIRLTADWSEQQANHVSLRVVDSGPGIDPAIAARIFEPFWTSREGSAGGLGLAICRRIVEEAGGTIGVYEQPEVGACIGVELPITR